MQKKFLKIKFKIFIWLNKQFRSPQTKLPETSIQLPKLSILFYLLNFATYIFREDMNVEAHNEKVHRDCVSVRAFHENCIDQKYVGNVRVKTCVVCL
jgi:hypothetical protein